VDYYRRVAAGWRSLQSRDYNADARTEANYAVSHLKGITWPHRSAGIPEQRCWIKGYCCSILLCWATASVNSAARVEQDFLKHIRNRGETLMGTTKNAHSLRNNHPALRLFSLRSALGRLLKLNIAQSVNRNRNGHLLGGASAKRVSGVIASFH